MCREFDGALLEIEGILGRIENIHRIEVDILKQQVKKLEHELAIAKDSVLCARMRGRVASDALQRLHQDIADWLFDGKVINFGLIDEMKKVVVKKEKADAS